MIFLSSRNKTYKSIQNSGNYLTKEFCKQQYISYVTKAIFNKYNDKRAKNYLIEEIISESGQHHSVCYTFKADDRVILVPECIFFFNREEIKTQLTKWLQVWFAELEKAPSRDRKTNYILVYKRIIC